MESPRPSKTSFEVSDYAIWGAIALGLVLLLASQSVDRSSRKSSQQSLLPTQSSDTFSIDERLAIENKVRQRLNQRVTEHLQMIDQTRTDEQWRVQQVNRDTAPSLDQLDLSFLSNDLRNPAHLANLPQDRSSEDVYRDISPERAADTGHWAEQRINAQLEHKKWMDAYEARYEAEFVNAFLANAREQGYEVELNEQLEVVDIKRIRRPEPMRFPQSESEKSPRESYGGAVR